MNSTMTEMQAISAYGPARPLWRAARSSPRNCSGCRPIGTRRCILSAGMIYLRDNPLLREPLKAEHVKRRLLGHWGSDPGMSLTYIHLNRLIKKYDLDMSSSLPDRDMARQP